MKTVYEACYFPLFTSVQPTSLGFFSTHEKAYRKIIRYADENYLILPSTNTQIKEHVVDEGD